MAYQKQWEELQIADDFIFGKVMQNCVKSCLSAFWKLKLTM